MTFMSSFGRFGWFDASRSAAADGSAVEIIGAAAAGTLT
jgi:hypothetical protein